MATGPAAGTAASARHAQLAALVQARRWSELETRCRALCAADGRDAEARAALALALAGLGRTAEAAQAYAAAIAIDPRRIEWYLHCAASQFPHSRESARQTLMLAQQHWPRSAPVAFHLGYLDEVEGRTAQAAQHYRAALREQPNYADAAANLAALLSRQGDAGAALAVLEAIAGAGVSRQDLAVLQVDVLLALQRADEALALARRLTDRHPGDAALLRVLVRAARQARDHATAVAGLHGLLRLDPSAVDLWGDLAWSQLDAADFPAATAALQECRRRAPDDLRFAWMDALALPLLPDDEDDTAAARERFAAGLAQLEASLPRRAATASTAADMLRAARLAYTFPLHYQAADNTALARRHGALIEGLARAAAPDLADPVPWRALAHGGRLRVGVVSSELREHTLMRFFAAWLPALADAGMDVHAWQLGAKRDAVTAALAARVVRLEQGPDDPLEFARRVRAARLDAVVLLDVGLNPVLHALAALRLAPVQFVTYGHPATTGLSTPDAFLGADAAEPADAAAHYTEPLLRLPGLGTRPERPLQVAADQGRPPRRDSPLFLCLQSLFKLTPADDRLLAQVLAATPAQLGLFTLGPRAGAVEARHWQRLKRIAQREGVDIEGRVTLYPRRDYGAYLAMVAAADVVLDSSWFSGGATSLDALHLGTPMVTWPGAMMRGRQTAAMLRIAGVEDTIAPDASGYVAVAERLARDPAWRDDVARRQRDGAARVFEGDAPLAALVALLRERVEAVA